MDKRTPLENIFEMVEFSGNSRRVLTDAALDATALQIVHGGRHESGHLSTPTPVTSREIVLGAPLEIADREIGTVIGRVHETTTTHVVAVAVATEINVVNTVVIETATATVNVSVIQAEIVVDTIRTRTVDTMIMNGFVNVQDEMTRVAREVHVATKMTRVICNLVPEIIAETMIKLAVDIMSPTLCLSTLCSNGQSDRPSAANKEAAGSKGKPSQEVPGNKHTTANSRSPSRERSQTPQRERGLEKLLIKQFNVLQEQQQKRERQSAVIQHNVGTAGLTTTTSSCRRFSAYTS